MIINCSVKVEKCFDLPINEVSFSPYFVTPLLIWRWDVIDLYQVESHILAVNEATMFSFLIPLRKDDGLQKVLLDFTYRLELQLKFYGRPFDSKNLNVLFSKNNDRSLLGSVNNLKEIYQVYQLSRKKNQATLFEMENRANQIPFKTIGYGFPEDKFRELAQG